MKNTNIIDKETMDKIERIIDTAEYCRHAYFWTNNGNRYIRSRREKEFNCDEVEWTEGGNEYSAEYHFSQSCKHTYAYGEYYRNGYKTNLTAIRNSFNRLKKAAAVKESRTK